MKNHPQVLDELSTIIRILDAHSAGNPIPGAFSQIEQSLAAIAPNIEGKESEHFADAKRHLTRVFNSEITGDFGRDSFILSRYHLTQLYRVIRPYKGNPDDFEAGFCL
jgi:hypothetical protein